MWGKRSAWVRRFYAVDGSPLYWEWLQPSSQAAFVEQNTYATRVWSRLEPWTWLDPQRNFFSRVERKGDSIQALNVKPNRGPNERPPDYCRMITRHKGTTVGSTYSIGWALIMGLYVCLYGLSPGLYGEGRGGGPTSPSPPLLAYRVGGPKPSPFATSVVWTSL